MIQPEHLNNNLLHVLHRARHSEPTALPHFEIMYRTGCRASESINRNLWTFESNKTVTLQPLKGNLSRHFFIEDLPASFITFLEYNEDTGYYYNYNTLSYLFKQLSLYRNIFIGNKESTLHLFRHNHVKLLLAEGYTDIEIQNTLGEKNMKSALSYITSTFHMQPQPPLVIELNPSLR